MQKVGPRVYAYSAYSRTRAARSLCTPKPPGHRKWPDPGSCPEVSPAPLRAGTSRPWRHCLRTAGYTAPLSVRNPIPRAPPPLLPLLVSPPPPSTHPVTAAVATTNTAAAAVAAGSLRQPPSPRFQVAGPAPRAEKAERIRVGRAVLPPLRNEEEPEDRGTRVCFRKQPNVLPRE